MSTEQATAPSLEEFKRLVRKEFAFVASFGFRDVPPPTTRYQNPFEVHFEKDGWKIVVEGLSYGFNAHISIRSPDGRSASLDYLRPRGFWETHRQSFARGQEGEISYWALGLREFGAPFLRGEWPVFEELVRRQEAWIEANREAWANSERARLMERAIQTANVAFRAARYAEAASELVSFEEFLPPAQVKKLAIARKRTNV
jgi:hypothetical protein